MSKRFLISLFLLYTLIFIFPLYAKVQQSPHSLILKAIDLLKLQQYKKACPLLKEAMVLDPNISYTYYYLGKCYDALGDKENAIEYYKKYREMISPDMFDIKLPSDSKENNPSLVDDIYNHKKSAELKYQKAKIAIEGGDFRLGISLLEEAIKLDNDQGKYYYLIARIYQDLGESKNAYNNYEKAFYFFEDDSKFLKNFFGLCVKMKKYSDAIKIARRISDSRNMDEDMKKKVYEISKKLYHKNNNTPLFIWKRAGKTIIIEHRFKEWENPVSLSFKEFDVFRGRVPLINPLTNEIIYEEPSKKVGRIRIERILNRVLMATILTEDPIINIGDYILIDKK